MFRPQNTGTISAKYALIIIIIIIIVVVSGVFNLDSHWVNINFTSRDAEIEFFQDVKISRPSK